MWLSCCLESRWYELRQEELFVQPPVWCLLPENLEIACTKCLFAAGQGFSLSLLFLHTWILHKPIARFMCCLNSLPFLVPQLDSVCLAINRVFLSIGTKLHIMWSNQSRSTIISHRINLDKLLAHHIMLWMKVMPMTSWNSVIIRLLFVITCLEMLWFLDSYGRGRGRGRARGRGWGRGGYGNYQGIGFCALPWFLVIGYILYGSIFLFNLVNFYILFSGRQWRLQWWIPQLGPRWRPRQGLGALSW